MASRRTQNKWDFKKDDGFKKTKEEKEMEEYMKTAKNKDRKVLERMLSKTVANKPKNQDHQPWKQLESIGEDESDNPLNAANSDQFYRGGTAQDISSALANFDMVFKSTPSTQIPKQTPAARAKLEQTPRFYLFFNTMERCVKRYIGDRSVPYILNQCWANLKDTYKEEFRTKSMELHLAFRKDFPEIVVETVDYDPYFMTPVIITSPLRVPKHPGSPFTYFRKVMTQEIKLNHPKMKTAQVSRQVQQRWNTLSVDERNRNKEAFQQAEAAYKHEMDKAPERQKALDNMKARIQIELEPFIKFCHGIVQRFKQSNHAYETFTTPQEKYRTLLAPTKRPLHDPVKRNTEKTLRFNQELMKNPVVAQFMSYEANDGEEPDMDLFEDHDPVEKTNGNTLKTKPEPGKEPNVARLVNHEADDCEDFDMDTFREFFPDYSMNKLPKHADDFVGNDSTPAKKMRYQDVEGSSTGHSPIETQMHGNEFDSAWDDWNGNPGYETNGFEANHVEFHSQQEQFDHNFEETANFGQVSEMPINTQSSVPNKLGLNHNTALGRFCMLELINLDGEIRNSFSDEMLCTYLCNRWEETSKGRKVEFELIGTNNMGNTSQFLDGNPNSPFGKFCDRVMKKLCLDSPLPDEMRLLLENLWNLDSEKNKSQYYILDDQRVSEHSIIQKFNYQPPGHFPTKTQLNGNEFDSAWDDWNEDPGHEANGFDTNPKEFPNEQEQFDHNFVETANLPKMPFTALVSISNNLDVDHRTSFGRFSLLELINLDGEIRNSFSDEMLCTYLCNRWEETSKSRKAEFELIGTNNMGNTSQLLDGHPNAPFGKFCVHAIKKLGLDSIQPDELRSLLGNLWNLDSEENKAQYYITDDQRTLNALQFSPVSPNMPDFEDHDVVDVKKRKTKRNQKQESSSQLDPAVLNPADISLY